ncbi:hypothetical protein [Tardiphaga sp.]|uniref:hypothetical protein n=1 Tax=Tardiphaga sp. TaxID=1926292 RepID=UPI002604670C|nr:hypothetical protein [Tardiphaga sp.]MDB5620551.1 hypothetical protein [Tardiphaga sp.]
MTLSLSPSFKRRFGPSAEAVAARMSATYGHLAVAIYNGLYDEPGELSSAAIQLGLDIRAADARRSESLAVARKVYGVTSPAYAATEFLASRQRADDYQRALDKYDLVVESADQLDEIEGTPELLAQAAE